MPDRGLPPLERARFVAGSALLLLALGAGLGACTDPLPAFANPPPYDAGADPDAGADEDAG